MLDFDEACFVLGSGFATSLGKKRVIVSIQIGRIHGYFSPNLSRGRKCSLKKGRFIRDYTVVKVDGYIATPKFLAICKATRGHDKPTHGSCAICFPGAIGIQSYYH